MEKCVNVHKSRLLGYQVYFCVTVLSLWNAEEQPVSMSRLLLSREPSMRVKAGQAAAVCDVEVGHRAWMVRDSGHASISCYCVRKLCASGGALKEVPRGFSQYWVRFLWCTARALLYRNGKGRILFRKLTVWHVKTRDKCRKIAEHTHPHTKH